MIFWITNASPRGDQQKYPYGVTKYAVQMTPDSETIEFSLDDVLHPLMYEQLVTLHGEQMKKLLDYIKGTLLNW